MTRTAYNPNPISIPLPLPSLTLLSVMLAAALVASPRLHAAEAGDPRRSATFDCDKRFISQRQAGWLLGTDNFSQTHARRAALYAEVARACAAGMTAVRIEGRRANASATPLSRR